METRVDEAESAGELRPSDKTSEERGIRDEGKSRRAEKRPSSVLNQPIASRVQLYLMAHIVKNSPALADKWAALRAVRESHRAEMRLVLKQLYLAIDEHLTSLDNDRPSHHLGQLIRTIGPTIRSCASRTLSSDSAKRFQSLNCSMQKGTKFSAIAVARGEGVPEFRAVLHAPVARIIVAWASLRQLYDEIALAAKENGVAKLSTFAKSDPTTTPEVRRYLEAVHELLHFGVDRNCGLDPQWLADANTAGEKGGARGRISSHARVPNRANSGKRGHLDRAPTAKPDSES